MKLKVTQELDLELLTKGQWKEKVTQTSYIDMDRWEDVRISVTDNPYLVVQIAKVTPEEEPLLDNQRTISTMQHYMEEQAAKNKLMETS